MKHIKDTIEEEIASLTLQRQVIDRKIAGLEAYLGEESEPAAEADEKPKREYKKRVGGVKPSKKKGQKVCKNCGEPGHMKKTCTSEKADVPAEEAEADAPAPQPYQVRITPDKLNRVKSLLKDPDNSVAFIAAEVGLPEERVEAIKDSFKS